MDYIVAYEVKHGILFIVIVHDWQIFEIIHSFGSGQIRSTIRMNL